MVVGYGRLVTYHDSFRVSAERVLQKASEFGVSVGDMATPTIDQCRDDIA